MLLKFGSESLIVVCDREIGEGFMRLPSLKNNEFWSDLLAILVFGLVKVWRAFSG